METFFVWLIQSFFRPAFWFQPLFYALHGWLATEMAIWMLFHPYKAQFIPGTGLQIPFTPGILPRGRTHLFESIASTVTRSLLSESDLHQQAEKLITPANLVRGIEALVDSVEREMRNTEQIRRMYRYGEEVIPALLSGFTTSLIDKLDSDQQGKLHDWLCQCIGKGLSQAHLSYTQSEFMTETLFDTLLTPHCLRKIMAEGLTEGNILVIEKSLAQQIGGVKGFLVRFMGVAEMLGGLRDFSQTHPEETEAQITEILDRLEIRERLAERISHFSFTDLPIETQLAVKTYIATLSTEMLADNRVEIREAIATWSGAASRLVINRLLQINLKQWLNEKRPDLKTELARFMDKYLHRELEVMIRGLLPVFNIEQMIVEKLNQFSNQQLERMIYGICQRELRWLAFLGAFLGFWLGLVSNLINHFLLA
ncbi:DUF445 family protein [Vampirovibrio sp.]|uniref:DUF445 family protein n=1 Tax=Vampirovibrio sp. TaxID=2717857 RepID=UPI003593EB0A